MPKFYFINKFGNEDILLGKNIFYDMNSKTFWHKIYNIKKIKTDLIIQIAKKITTFKLFSSASYS